MRVYAATAALAVRPLLFAFFRFTDTGVAIRACADNLVGAAVVGLDVKKLYALTFGLGLACVGAAGADGDADRRHADDRAGLYAPRLHHRHHRRHGSMTGAIVGGLLIGVAEALASVLVAPSMKTMASFGLLVLILALRPQGLLGKRA